MSVESSKPWLPFARTVVNTTQGGVGAKVNCFKTLAMQTNSPTEASDGWLRFSLRNWQWRAETRACMRAQHDFRSAGRNCALASQHTVQTTSPDLLGISKHIGVCWLITLSITLLSHTPGLHHLVVALEAVPYCKLLTLSITVWSKLHRIYHNW